MSELTREVRDVLGHLVRWYYDSHSDSQSIPDQNLQEVVGKAVLLLEEHYDYINTKEKDNG